MSRDVQSVEPGEIDLASTADAVLARLRVAADGDAERELSWSSAIDGIGGTYLASRRLLGFMLERGWIVRHGRDRVSITRRALTETRDA